MIVNVIVYVWWDRNDRKLSKQPGSLVVVKLPILLSYSETYTTPPNGGTLRSIIHSFIYQKTRDCRALCLLSATLAAARMDLMIFHLMPSAIGAGPPTTKA